MSIKKIDLSLNLFFASIGTILGSIYFILGDYRILIAALAALLSSTVVFTTMKHRRKEIVSFLLAFLFVFFNYNIRSELLEFRNVAAILNQYEKSQWKVISEPKDKFFNSEFLVEFIVPPQSSLKERIKLLIAPIRLIGKTESRFGLEKDDVLELNQKVELDNIKKERAKFTKKDKVFFQLKNSSELKFVKHQTNFIDDLRDKIADYYENTLSKDNALIITSLLLGSKSSELPQYFINNVRKLGLGHFLAASGFNLLILTLVLTWIFNILRLNNQISSAISLVAIFIYSGLAGFSPSVVRAAVFAAIFLILKFFNRKSLSLKLLIYLAGLLLFIDPYGIFDIGFQLSYLATAAIIVWNPIISAKINKLPLPKFITEVTTVTLAVQIFVYPLTVYYFNNLQIWSLLSNIILSPILSVLSILAFCGMSFIIEPYLNVVKFFIEKAQLLPGIDCTQELSFNGFIFLTILINVAALLIFKDANKEDWDFKNMNTKLFDENVKNFIKAAINNRYIQIALLVSSLSMLVAVELDPINITKYTIEKGFIRGNKEITAIIQDKTINHAYFKIGELNALLIKKRTSIKDLGSLTNDIREVNILFLPNLNTNDIYFKNLLELIKPQFTICSVAHYDTNKLKPRVKENLEIIGKNSNTIVNEGILYIKDNKYWQLRVHPL